MSDLAQPDDTVYTYAQQTVYGQGSSPGMAALDTRRTQDFNARAMQPGYDHQSSYADERAQWATVYGIVQLTKLADWAA